MTDTAPPRRPIASWGLRVMPAASLLDAGWTRSRIDHELRRGAIISVAPAWFVDHEMWRHATPARRHALRAEAQHRRLPGSAISHLSAAVWRGLPVPERFEEERPVDLTVPGPRGITQRAGVRLHTRARGRPDIVAEHGVLLTSVASTVVECLLTLAAEDSVAIADAALHRRMTRAQDITAAAAGHARVPGMAALRRAVDLADGAREPPLESLAAVRLDRPDRPRPSWQAEIYDSGTFTARVDALWEEWGVVLELDGRAKYQGDPTGRGLWQEKRREDRLRALGLTVLRFSHVELAAPTLAWVSIDEARARSGVRSPSLQVVTQPPRQVAWPRQRPDAEPSLGPAGR